VATAIKLTKGCVYFSSKKKSVKNISGVDPNQDAGFESLQSVKWSRVKPE